MGHEMNLSGVFEPVKSRLEVQCLRLNHQTSANDSKEGQPQTTPINCAAAQNVGVEINNRKWRN